MRGYVYFIRMCGKDLFKIGMTTQSASARLGNIQSDLRKRLKDKTIKLLVHGFLKSDNIERDETMLHDFFSAKRIHLTTNHREWFELDANTVDRSIAECKTPDSLSIIDKLETTEAYIKNLEHQLNNPESNHYYTNDEFSAIHLGGDIGILADLKKKRIKRLREWKKRNYRPEVMMEKFQ